MRMQPSELAKLALIVWGADLLARKHRLLDQWKHLLVPLVPGRRARRRAWCCSATTSAPRWSSWRSSGRCCSSSARRCACSLFAWLAVRRGRRDPGADQPDPDEAAGQLAQPRARTTSTPGWQARARPLRAGHRRAGGASGWARAGRSGARCPRRTPTSSSRSSVRSSACIGTLTVLLLFVALAYGGFRIALRSTDLFVRLAAGGVTAWVMIQAVVNIGAVLGLLPIVGVLAAAGLLRRLVAGHRDARAGHAALLRPAAPEAGRRAGCASAAAPSLRRAHQRAGRRGSRARRSLAGGGSAGHVEPLLCALADALRRRDPRRR